MAVEIYFYPLKGVPLNIAVEIYFYPLQGVPLNMAVEIYFYPLHTGCPIKHGS